MSRTETAAVGFEGHGGGLRFIGERMFVRGARYFRVMLDDDDLGPAPGDLQLQEGAVLDAVTAAGGVGGIVAGIEAGVNLYDRHQARAEAAQAAHDAALRAAVDAEWHRTRHLLGVQSLDLMDAAFDWPHYRPGLEGYDDYGPDGY